MDQEKSKKSIASVLDSLLERKPCALGRTCKNEYCRYHFSHSNCLISTAYDYLHTIDQLMDQPEDYIVVSKYKRGYIDDNGRYSEYTEVLFGPATNSECDQFMTFYRGSDILKRRVPDIS